MAVLIRRDRKRRLQRRRNPGRYPGPIPTVDAPKSTPIVRLNPTHGSTDIGTATMVLTMPECYPDDLLVAVFTTGGLANPITNSAGLAFTNWVGFGPGATCTIQYLSRRAAASADGGTSTDYGSTATFTVPDTTQKWLGTVFAVGGAHRTYATAINQAVQTTGTGVATLAITGGTATVDNGLTVTIAAFGGSTANLNNRFLPDLTMPSGQTEQIFDALYVDGGTGRGRALGIWVTPQSPINGVLQETRTVTMQGSILGGMAGLSFTFAPMLSEAGDNFWDVPAQQHMASATLNRMDILLPATGSRPSTGWPWVLYVHGGVTGNKRLEVGTEDAVLALLSSTYNTAVVSMHFRGVGVTQPQNTGVDRGQDIQATVRYLRSEACARYGLRTDRLVAWGTSLGASILAAEMLSPDSPIILKPELGCAGVDSNFDAVLLWYPESNGAACHQQWVNLGITPSRTDPETAGSSEEINLMGYANIAYNGQWQGIKNEPRFDAAAYPLTGSPTQDSSANRYNVQQAQWWVGHATADANTLHVRISHGNLDDQVPVLNSFNDQTGVGAGTPTGLYQKLVNAGFTTTYNENTGANHDLATNYWKPTGYVGALAPAFVDRDIQWLVNAAADNIGDESTGTSRRSRLAGVMAYFKLMGLEETYSPGWL